MAWSDAARAAALEARRLHAQHTVDRTHRATASHKPSTKAKQVVAQIMEGRVRQALGVRQAMVPGYPVDARGRGWGIEIKTIMDNKNSKITMHPSSIARKTAWSKSNKSRLSTVAVDMQRGGAVFFHAGVGAFRMRGMTQVRNATHLRQLVKGM